LKIRVSAGTARILGLKKLKMDASMTSAYLMVGEHCVFNCAYCAQARKAKSRQDMLSRIVWPQYDLNEIVARIHDSTFLRICIQVVNSLGYFESVLHVIQALQTRIPISVSIRTLDSRQVMTLFGMGVDRIGLPLDVATPRLYHELRGGDFHAAKSFIIESAHHFPNKVSTHLIVGLGETDEELLSIAQEFIDARVLVSLFAFTPVRGTQMESHPAPPLARYRKLQFAVHAMAEGSIRFQNLEFTPEGELATVVDLPLAKRRRAVSTAGCPGCTRPFYNERPGGVIYNIPLKEGCEVEASDV